MNMTEKEDRVYLAIRRILKQEGEYPSFSRLAEELGLSKARIQQYIDILREKGVLGRPQRSSGAYFIQDFGEDPAGEFEKMSKIAAGLAQEDQETERELIKFDKSFFVSQRGEKKSTGEIKVLEVYGESMNRDGIFSGDFALIKLGNEFGKDDIGAFRVEGEGITLKRMKVLKNSIRLIPSNPKFNSQLFDNEKVEIIGRLVGVVRKV